MSIYPPPSEFTPIFNPAYYQSANDSLTQAQGDSRYLQLLAGGTEVGPVSFVSSSTFSAGLTSSGNINSTAKTLIANGSLAAPSLTFTSSPNLGFYSLTGNQFSIAASGTQVCNIDATGFAFNSGGSTNPSVAFLGSRTSGLYYAGAGNIAASVSGSNVLTLSSSAVTTPNQLVSSQTTASTSSTTGSIKGAGGLGVAKNAWIGGSFSNTVNSTNGNVLNIPTLTFTDSSTAASGTVGNNNIVCIRQPTIAATNNNVLTTDAASMFITGAPILGSNQTFTNTYGLYIDSLNTTGATVTEASSLYIKNKPTVTSGKSYALKINSGLTLLNDSTAATSAATGAFVVSGGIGVGDSIFLQSCKIVSFVDANFNSISLTTSPVSFATGFSDPTGAWNIYMSDGASYGTMVFGFSKSNGGQFYMSIEPQGGTLVNSLTLTVFLTTTTTAVITCPGFNDTITLSYNTGTNAITLQATTTSISTFSVKRSCFGWSV